MTLAQIRDEIDAIDGEIVSLLHRRLLLARRTRSLKKRPADPARERQVLERIGKMLPDYPLLRREFATGLFTEIMREGRLVQRRPPGRKNKEATS